MGRLGAVQISALVRDPRAPAAHSLEQAGIHLLTSDLTAADTVRAAVRGQDMIVHAADVAAGSRSARARQQQVDATIYLYRAACEAGVQRLIGFSALLAAGADALPTGDPDTDLRLETERCLRAAEQTDGAQIVILRLACVYGPGVKRWTVEPITRAQQRRLRMPGSGAYAFPYLYIENLVDAVTAAAAADACGTYDVLDGFTSYAEYLGHYARMAGTQVRSLPLPVLMGLGWLEELQCQLLGRSPRFTRAGLRSQLRGQPPEPPYAEKALRELGWQPRVSLEEGMAAIERSNGFHKPATKQDVNPWKENENWIRDENTHTD
jgi:nucleoside-diphosphate-sugar epimerase